MFKNILVAIDVNDAESAEQIAAHATDLARSTGARLQVVNVVPDTGMAMVSAALGPEHSKNMLDEATKALAGFASKALPDVADKDLHVLQGSIYDSIIRTANRVDADLIMVGSHRPELRDYLVGPNAARVARHATRSVLIVR